MEIAVVLAIVVAIFVFRSIKVVPQQNAWVVERLGKYHRDARRTFYGWADVWRDPEFEGWDIRAEGITAGPPLAMYLSEETHVVSVRAADMLGLGTNAVRTIRPPTAQAPVASMAAIALET